MHADANDFPIAIRAAPFVTEQPRVRLDQWCVLGDGSSLYLAGVLANGSTLRVTTAIVSLDPVTRTWRTSSGRVYDTPGPPARDPQLRELLHQMASVLHRNFVLTDKTVECWRRICSKGK